VLACEKDDFTDLKSKFNYLDFGIKKYLSMKEKTIKKHYETFISEVPCCLKCGGFIDGNKDDKIMHNCCEER